MRDAILVGALVVVVGAARADPTAPIPQYSVWVGSYTCAQGITSVKLTIETREHGGDATGHFQFGPHTNNPKLPKGDYWMKGTARPTANGELQVVLKPDKWALQPAGWVMVGVTARSDREQRTMTGTIDHPTCTTLSVTRQMPEADVAR